MGGGKVVNYVRQHLRTLFGVALDNVSRRRHRSTGGEPGDGTIGDVNVIGCHERSQTLAKVVCGCCPISGGANGGVYRGPGVRGTTGGLTWGILDKQVGVAG